MKFLRVKLSNVNLMPLKRRVSQKDSTFQRGGTRGLQRRRLRRKQEHALFRLCPPSYLGLSVATPSNQDSTVSRLTGKLDPGLEPPRVQMHRFDPSPLISSRPLLITLRSKDYLELGWFMGFRFPRTKESPESGLTADLLWLLALEAHATISLKELHRSWLTFSIWKWLVPSDVWFSFLKGDFHLLFLITGTRRWRVSYGASRRDRWILFSFFLLLSLFRKW